MLTTQFQTISGTQNASLCNIIHHILGGTLYSVRQFNTIAFELESSCMLSSTLGWLWTHPAIHRRLPVTLKLDRKFSVVADRAPPIVHIQQLVTQRAKTWVYMVLARSSRFIPVALPSELTYWGSLVMEIFVSGWNSHRFIWLLGACLSWRYCQNQGHLVGASMW